MPIFSLFAIYVLQIMFSCRHDLSFACFMFVDLDACLFYLLLTLFLSTSIFAMQLSLALYFILFIYLFIMCIIVTLQHMKNFEALLAMLGKEYWYVCLLLSLLQELHQVTTYLIYLF